MLFYFPSPSFDLGISLRPHKSLDKDRILSIAVPVCGPFGYPTALMLVFLSSVHLMLSCTTAVRPDLGCALHIVSLKVTGIEMSY